MPALFIDHTDILAKHELSCACQATGKHQNTKIVFVSSEGSISPVIQKLSGISRCLKIFEITDVSDEAAVDYLIKHDCLES